VETRWPSYFAWRLAPLGAAAWPAARDRLAPRGWTDAAGKATARGRDEIEWHTGRPTPPATRWVPPEPSGSPT
jgi:hypothetical protein